EMETGCAVEALELDADGRVQAARCGRGDRARQVEGDVFLTTVPLPMLLGRLLPPVPMLAPARRAALGLHYLDMVFVVLIVRRKVITGDNWLYFPEPELIFNRGYEAKSFDPGMGPEDRSVLCLEITTTPGDAISRESDE